MTTPDLRPDPATLSDADLSAAIETSCAVAARHYTDGQDTTSIDAYVDALLAEHATR